MLPDQKELLELIVERLNSGSTQAEIATQLGVSKVKISRIVNAGLKEGIFHRTFGVYTHCLLKPSWIMISTVRTGTVNVNEITPKPDFIYLSIFPVPTFFMYFLRTLEPKVHTGSVKIMELSKIIESLIVYEFTFSRRLKLDVCKKCVVYDDIDEFLAITILKDIHFSKYDIDLYTLWKEVGLTNIHSVKYHYYNHLLNNLVYKRYIIRPRNSMRVILRISSPSMAKAVSSILKLYREKILVGVDIFDIAYHDPFRAYLVAWIDPIHAWEKLYTIDLPSHVKVEIFPVKLVYPAQE